jgi:hypothetical protein
VSPRVLSDPFATFPRMGHLLGHARVSASEQNADLQTDEVGATGCWKVYVDHASGSLGWRPAAERSAGAVWPGDTLVV